LFYSENKKYKSSIDLDGIILDISEDNYIMSIEILDASEKFNVSKLDIRNIKHLDATIVISKENIKVSLKMEMSKRNKLIDSCLDAVTINSMNIPASTQAIAVSC
jgi:uncharacterized protein YuzE